MQYRHVMLLAFAACDPNQAGNLAATKLGDTTHPLGRGSPIDALRDACGDGALSAAGGATVRRRPYLQEVTTSSSMIGWVTMDPVGEHVDVTAPGGGLLA